MPRERHNSREGDVACDDRATAYVRFCDEEPTPRTRAKQSAAATLTPWWCAKRRGRDEVRITRATDHHGTESSGTELVTARRSRATASLSIVAIAHGAVTDVRARRRLTTARATYRHASRITGRARVTPGRDSAAIAHGRVSIERDALTTGHATPTLGRGTLTSGRGRPSLGTAAVRADEVHAQCVALLAPTHEQVCRQRHVVATRQSVVSRLTTTSPQKLPEEKHEFDAAFWRLASVLYTRGSMATRIRPLAASPVTSLEGHHATLTLPSP